MKHLPRRYHGYLISQGNYTGTSDDVAGRWYVDDPDSDTYDRRGPGFVTLAEAKEDIRRRGYSTFSPHWDANGTGHYHVHDQRLACPIGSDDALVRKIKRGDIKP